jgi:divalent metal cation (Fe/Co/Zn/Cd) transporter
VIPRRAPAKSGTTRRSVLVSFVVNCAETLGLAVAAGVTGAVALRAQTAANAAEVAVQVFLLIGVLSSVRPPDQTHPLGYGRERFFWSLLAALGIFLGGGVLGLDEAVHAAVYPSAVHSYPVAYLVLVTTVVLDAFALEIGLRPVREQAAGRGVSLRDYMRRSTDPASTTVVVGGGCSVIGGITATAGLVLSEVTGNPAPDTVASALIGLLLLLAKQLLIVALLQVHDRPVAGTGDLDHRGAVRRGVRQRRQPVQKPRSRHRQADPGRWVKKSAAAAA